MIVNVLLPRGFKIASFSYHRVKHLHKARDLGSIPQVQEDPLEKSWQPTPVLNAGKSQQTEEPGRPQSMGSQVGF